MSIPLFHWIQVLALCAVALIVGFLWGKRPSSDRNRNTPNNDPGQPSNSPAIEHLNLAFKSGQLGFAESLELAATYRRKGDLEQAITIHQSLYGRPGLAWQDMQRAQFELAKDFFQAGILSRAEDLLESLIEQKGILQITTAELLVRLYIQQKDWHKAANLFINHPQMINGALKWTYAHVLCEQAHLLMSHKPHQAEPFILMARQHHPDSIRPTLLMMQMAQQQRRWRDWLNQVQTFLREHPDRIDLVKDAIISAIEQEPTLKDRMATLLKSLSQQPQIRLFRAELAMRMQQPQSAVALLKSVDLNWQTLLLRLRHLVNELNHDELNQLYQKLLDADHKRLRYQCGHCGFEALQHHWQCPQCERWETLKPADIQPSQNLLL